MPDASYNARKTRRPKACEKLRVSIDSLGKVVIHPVGESPDNCKIELLPGNEIGVSLPRDYFIGKNLSGFEKAIFIKPDSGKKLCNLDDYLCFPEHSDLGLVPLKEFAGSFPDDSKNQPSLFVKLVVDCIDQSKTSGVRWKKHTNLTIPELKDEYTDHEMLDGG